MELNNLPKLGFGMMRLPKAGDKIDLPQVKDMVDAYMASGMCYFDTAYMYCDGKSESVAKAALVDRYPRESFWLTTKLPIWMIESMEDRDRIFADQLQRTGAGYFDLYLLHSVEESNAEKYLAYDCFSWAMAQKEKGLIRHFGFSFHGTPELLDQLLTDHPETEIVQIQLNYADWDNPMVQSRRLYEVLRKHTKPILVMEPVKGGSLASTTPDVEARMKEALPEASVASWALRFVGSLPGVATILSGMSTREQMADNVATLGSFRPLNEEEQTVIAYAQQAIAQSPAVPCTSCRYCMDGCPQGIHIPDVFRALSTLRLYGEQEQPHEFYRELVKTSGKASDCLQCGQCEGVCPQHLPITQLLQEAASRLD